MFTWKVIVYMESLYNSIDHVKGIGPKTSLLLNRINIFTIEDLIMYFPKAYEDRSNIRPINELVNNEYYTIIGNVSLIDRDRYTATGKHITRIIIKNESGDITAIWYNQRFIKKNFKKGEKYLFYGRVSKAFSEIQILNPEYEKNEDQLTQSILPVYPLTKNLSQKILRTILYKLVNSGEFVIKETLPENIKYRFGLCDIDYAIKNIHFPGDNNKRLEAEKRIKFDELLLLQLGLMLEKNKFDNSKRGISFIIPHELQSFIGSLPFELTTAQKTTINEVLNDMKSCRPMNRLVQGDVGSGKTIIAVVALFNAVKNGCQGVMMAPTEILAYQHYESLTAYFNNYGIRLELLSGKKSKKQKENIKEKIKNGEIDILIGTHAVIENDVEFKKLGLIITDEQHRFGVRQRALLNQKGINLDVLVMTATPIPRTLALFIYGDLDISVINELPPGRQKIDTYAVKPSMRPRIYKFIRQEIQNGRQAYIVCPIIDESDVLDAESAIELAEKLKLEYLKDINVGLLHGRMKSQEKDEIMMNFKDGKIDVLVSTTVIEVGINVQNATIMAIENADRFGLSQLHQLRGRVGRGQYKSYCILISDMKTDISKERMKIMKQISNGFKISEKDMALRGTGEFFGTKQHGLTELKLADILRDVDLLKLTNSFAKELIISGDIWNLEFNDLKLKVENKIKQKSDNIILN